MNGRFCASSRRILVDEMLTTEGIARSAMSAIEAAPCPALSAYAKAGCGKNVAGPARFTVAGDCSAARPVPESLPRRDEPPQPEGENTKAVPRAPQKASGRPSFARI